MLEAIITGLVLGTLLVAILEQARGGHLAAGDWAYAAIILLAALAVVWALPPGFYRPLRELALAGFVFALGYGLIKRACGDPHERNNRYLGWVLVVFSAFLAVATFL